MKLTPLLPVLLTLLALPLLAADPKAKAPDVPKLDPSMGAGKAAAASAAAPARSRFIFQLPPMKGVRAWEVMAAD